MPELAERAAPLPTRGIPAMPEIEAPHPPADRLAGYAQGRLAEPEMDEIEQHLVACDSCRQAVRDLTDD
jgi:hypothetical protein